MGQLARPDEPSDGDGEAKRGETPCRYRR